MVTERSTANPDVDGRRNRSPELGQQRLHQVDGTDDIGARRPIENDQDRRLAVGEAGVAKVLDGIGDFADIRETDRCALAIGDDQRFVIVGLVGLVVGIDLIALVTDVDSAFRAMRVGAGERGPHVFEADAIFVERLRDEFGANRRQRTAADDHFANAVDLRQFLRQHGRRRVIEVAAGQGIRRQGEDQDRRISRIGFFIGRVGPQAGRQVGASGVDRSLHVARGAIDVAVEAKLQGDANASPPCSTRSSR